MGFFATVIVFSLCCSVAPAPLMNFGVTSGDSHLNGVYSENGFSFANITLERPIVYFSERFTTVSVSLSSSHLHHYHNMVCIGCYLLISHSMLHQFY